MPNKERFGGVIMCRACFSPLILRNEFFPTKNTPAFESESPQSTRRNFMAASVAAAAVASGRPTGSIADHGT